MAYVRKGRTQPSSLSGRGGPSTGNPRPKTVPVGQSTYKGPDKKTIAAITSNPTSSGSQQKKVTETGYNVPKFDSVPDVNDTLLGNLNIDQDKIMEIYQKATRDEFKGKAQALQDAENRFSSNLYNTQMSARDAIRKANASATATGASRGIQASQEFGALLGLQDQSTDAATELAQARAALGLQEQAELSKDVMESMMTADQNKLAIGGLANNKYATDTQFSVGQMDYTAAMETAIKNLEGVLDSNQMQAVVAEINKMGQVESATLNKEGYTESAEIRAKADKTIARIYANKDLTVAEMDKAVRAEYNKVYEQNNIRDNATRGAQVGSTIASGSGTKQDEIEFQSLIANYIEDGSPSAESSYLTAMTSHGIDGKDAQKKWDEYQDAREKAKAIKDKYERMKFLREAQKKIGKNISQILQSSTGNKTYGTTGLFGDGDVYEIPPQEYESTTGMVPSR
jgi:hypothetical protein